MKVLDLNGAAVGEQKVPVQFEESINPDLISRAVLTIQSNRRQPYGTDPEAGKKVAAELSKRRKKYRGSYGAGISRVPRKILSRRGTRMNWVGAFVPGTVGGRRAHPPSADKIWTKKINRKENRKAIRSALAASINKDAVIFRGHVAPENYPFFVDAKLEALQKTKEVKDVLKKLGLDKELVRSSKKTIRAGKGKNRGRKYKKTTGPLIVVSNDCKLTISARNIAGVDIVKVKELNAELLSPGCAPGRLTLFTKPAIEILEKEKLFM